MPVGLALEVPSTFVVPAWGTVTYYEVIELIDKLLERAPELRGARILVIGERVSETPRVMELAGIARAIKPLLEHGVARIAFATPAEFVYQAARAFCAFANLVGANAASFRSVAEARVWLAGR